jgi:hypothetical protein
MFVFAAWMCVQPGGMRATVYLLLAQTKAVRNSHSLTQQCLRFQVYVLALRVMKQKLQWISSSFPFLLESTLARSLLSLKPPQLSLVQLVTWVKEGSNGSREYK